MAAQVNSTVSGGAQRLTLAVEARRGDLLYFDPPYITIPREKRVHQVQRAVVPSSWRSSIGSNR
jgi:hypothetical protein